MKLRILYLSVVLALSPGFIPMRSLAQNGGGDWMARLPGTALFVDMVIPGAHDAATGEGLRPSFLGVTQILGLADLWEAGVRAFDLRPAVLDSTLHVYHGPLRTRISFQESLSLLVSKLVQHPSEFAVVLIREEVEAENKHERQLWPKYMGQIVDGLGKFVASYRQNITLDELRGKILFVSRSDFASKSICLVSGWSHAPTGTNNASLKSKDTGDRSPVVVHDFYHPSTEEMQIQKSRSCINILERSALYRPSDTLYINHISGYFSTWMGFTPFATTLGYARNAARQHPPFLEAISACRKSGLSPRGIYMCDFIGTDTLKIKGHRPRTVYGKQLLKSLIEANFE